MEGMTIMRVSRENQSILSMGTTNDDKSRSLSHPLDQILPTFNLSKDASFIPTLKLRTRNDRNKERNTANFQKDHVKK